MAIFTMCMVHENELLDFIMRPQDFQQNSNGVSGDVMELEQRPIHWENNG
jgi:hypothetical protein